MVICTSASIDLIKKMPVPDTPKAFYDLVEAFYYSLLASVKRPEGQEKAILENRSRKKRKMENTISLNVLVIPPKSDKDITRRNIIVLKVSPNDRVDQLKPMIKERWPVLLKEVEPTGIILVKSDDSWQRFSDQLHQYKMGRFPGCEEMFPEELISKYFPTQPSNNLIHVIVTIYVYKARKGPSASGKLDLLRVCIEMLGKAIDELKREIFVFMHKTRHAGVVVSDSEEDDEYH
ncbi:hypothetical protein RhiirA5_384057 [Rhizophagus irregularis]|uniref:Crinkler effector protein N-terminal domain-containing protein n=1 Tax=Rhizophagus irregularis TaxID=588596 RepID=A0A2N0NUM6_9GLOM|nr:hypothetical protein RhiirA5_384057 [Rhizophagus irregularis]